MTKIKIKLIFLAATIGLALFFGNIKNSLAGNCGTNNAGTCKPGSLWKQCTSPEMWVSGGNSCPSGQWCCAIPPGTTTNPSATNPPGTNPSINSSGGFTYTPMENIPGFPTSGDFPSYILAVYNFGLWIVGIAALLMISIGGYMYITSAGNTSRTGKAKEIITDAIIGVVMALTSWILLYEINPELVQIHPLKPLAGAPGTGAAGLPGTSGGPAGTTNGYKNACPNTSSTSPIDYTKASSDSSIKINSNCDKYSSLFSQYGSTTENAKMLRAIAQLESACGSKKGPSSAGACGLMQMLPSTASSLAGYNVTCDQLNQNDQLAIQLAAKYVAQAQSGQYSQCTGGSRAAIFAGYNSGYGCGSAACSPKHALCASSDCQGAKAYECCINPGGLDQSINYAWNGMGIYSKL